MTGEHMADPFVTLKDAHAECEAIPRSSIVLMERLRG